MVWKYHINDLLKVYQNINLSIIHKTFILNPFLKYIKVTNLH